MRELAQKVVRICRELALLTEEPGRTTRTFLSPPMRDVHRILGEWMRELGMQVWVDAAGNLRGIHGNPNSRRLMIASHLDTVPNAGAFDGILGVVMGIALVETEPTHTTMPIEVVGFSEEEGVRFGTPFIGSRAVTGTLVLTREVEQAIRDYGLDPSELDKAGVHKTKIAPQVAGYLEFHIEQGPVLDRAGLPLAVVDAIVGQSRWALTFEGHANHAGTTPMNHRHDALAAAAEWIVAVEKTARSNEGLVATVGALRVSPDAGNVIAGSVRASLDVRHASDNIRLDMVNALLEAAAAIASRRGITLQDSQVMNQATVPMNAELCDALAGAVGAAGCPVHRMTSGAGHDAMILAPWVPSTMLFLRSPGGISHHPDESVLTGDVAAALEVGRRFMAGLELNYV
jgi:allantoate deiminase